MTLPKGDEEKEELNQGRKSQVIYCNKTTHTRLHAPMMMTTTHASSTDPAAVLPTLLARPLRTLNNINSAPHVIQLHPNNSPKLSGKEQKHFSNFAFQLFHLIYFFKCMNLLVRIVTRVYFFFK
jgi:hypothetical protein